MATVITGTTTYFLMHKKTPGAETQQPGKNAFTFLISTFLKCKIYHTTFFFLFYVFAAEMFFFFLNLAIVLECLKVFNLCT